MSRDNWQGYCWHCRQPLKAYDYQRENRCPVCGKATYCCLGCEYYLPGKANSCKEPIADYVNDKERANFCDYFSPASKLSVQPAAADPDQALKDAEDLFN